MKVISSQGINCEAANIYKGLELLKEAMDRNTAAIYDTAKVQPASALKIDDDFIFAVNTAINGFRQTNHPNLAAALSRGLREVEKARQS